MNTLKKHFFTVVFIVLGVVICFGPHGLFPICSKLRPDGTPMSCYYTAKLVTALGAGLIIVNFFGFIKDSKLVRYIVNCLNIAIAFIGIALPNRVIPIGDMKTMGWQIAYCKKPDMMCNHGLKPALNIILPAIIIISVIAIVYNFLRSSDHA